MGFREGDRVLVNVAPFIGSARRSKESVPCAVAAVADTRIQVSAEAPYRSVTLWVDRKWIDRPVGTERVSAGEPGMHA